MPFDKLTANGIVRGWSRGNFLPRKEQVGYLVVNSL
jgi:hypothetical protein